MKKRFTGFLLLILSPLLLAGCGKDDDALVFVSIPQGSPSQYLYVANYNDNSILTYRFNSDAGTIVQVGVPLPTAGNNPVKILPHPNKKFLYVVNATSDNISAFAINSSNGSLAALAPAAINSGLSFTQSGVIDPSGKYLYVADGSGNINGFSIDPISGALTALGGIFPIGIVGGSMIDLKTSPNGKFLYALDENFNVARPFLINTVNGNLTAQATTGTGTTPARIVFASTGLFTYVADSAFANVQSLSAHPVTGALASLNFDFASYTTVNRLAISPNDQFIYIGGGTDDQITVLQINSATGIAAIQPSATSTPTVGTPNDLLVDATGKYLFVAASSPGVIDSVLIMSIDPMSGNATQIGSIPQFVNANPTALAIVVQ